MFDPVGGSKWITSWNYGKVVEEVFVVKERKVKAKVSVGGEGKVGGSTSI